MSKRNTALTKGKVNSAISDIRREIHSEIGPTLKAAYDVGDKNYLVRRAIEELNLFLTDDTKIQFFPEHALKLLILARVKAYETL